MKDLLAAKLRSAITLGLILWCAGAGCMIVSVAHGAAMTETEVAQTNSGFGQVSGSAGAHDCCKARHAAERHRASSKIDRSPVLPQSLSNIEGLAELPNSSDAMSCCPLTSGTLVLNGRQRISNEEASVSRGSDAAVIAEHFTPAPAANPSRVLRQNQTYLRDCVFLI